MKVISLDNKNRRQ